jgi:hypothetical protein
MNWLEDLISVAEKVVAAPETGALVNDAVGVAEMIAPPPVVAGINTLKAFVATPLGQEIIAAGADVFTHMVGAGGSVLIEPKAPTLAAVATAAAAAVKP